MTREHLLRLKSDDLASRIVSDVYNTCLIYLGGDETTDNLIAGAIHADVYSELPNSVTDIEMKIPLQDRIVFRSREFCELIVVYTSGSTAFDKKVVGRVCKLLQKDPMSPRVGYLTSYHDFMKRFYTLTTSYSLREASSGSFSSASTIDSSDMDTLSPSLSPASLPSHDERRQHAHSVVFGKMDQSITYKCVPPTEVLPGLYLGNAQNAANYRQLSELGVSHVFNVSTEVDNLHTDKFAYTRHQVEDTEDEAALLKEAFDDLTCAIDDELEAGGAVLVHCLVGISRSSAVVIAYLMRRFGWSSGYALRFLRSKRPIVNPNKGLMIALEAYELELS